MVRLFARTRAAGRHTHFYSLREALDGEGCPVCRLSLDAVAHHLDSLAYEQVNDLSLREKLRAARGFCPHHAWQFLRQPSSGLGTALIYRDVLGEVTRILEQGQPGGLLAGYRRRTALDRRLLPRASCPTCAVLANSESRYLTTLVDHLSEPDFADAYLSHNPHSGLCLPHLERALDYRPDPLAGRALFLGTINSLHSTLELSAGADADRRQTLVRLLAGSQGGLTHREPPIRPVGTGRGETKTAEELVAAMEGEVCPMCVLAREADIRALARIIDRHAELNPQLCNLHAWRLSGSDDDPAADALLDAWARSVLGRPSECIPGTDAEGSVSGAEALSGIMSELHPCAVESERAEVEMAWAAALARSVQTTTIQAALRRSPGLCLPHLILALRCADPVGAQTLARLEADRIGALVKELDEYVRKQDYRFRGEAWGQEVTAPRRAVELTVGLEGLRGVGGLWWPDRKK